MKRTFLFMILLAAFVLPVTGQDLQQGYVPYGSFDFGTIDSVNLQNHNLVINIPIVTYKQKGTLPDFVLKLMYIAPQWSSFTFEYGCDAGSVAGSGGYNCDEGLGWLGGGSSMGLASNTWVMMELEPGGGD